MQQGRGWGWGTGMGSRVLGGTRGRTTMESFLHGYWVTSILPDPRQGNSTYSGMGEATSKSRAPSRPSGMLWSTHTSEVRSQTLTPIPGRGTRQMKPLPNSGPLVSPPWREAGSCSRMSSTSQPGDPPTSAASSPARGCGPAGPPGAAWCPAARPSAVGTSS